MIDRQVSQTLEQVYAFVRKRDDAWNIPADQGRFLHTTVLATGATRLLELGTSYGYSGLWLGSAAKANGGRMITIDKEQRKRDTAVEHFARAGLAETIVARVGDITEIVDGLEGVFDFVFIDADKPPTADYVEQLLGKLTARATIFIDNVLSHPDAFGDSLDRVRANPKLLCTTVPIGHGVEMAVKV